MHIHWKILFILKNAQGAIKSGSTRKQEKYSNILKDRLDAAFSVAGEAFKKTKFTMKDIDNTMKSVRRKAYGKKE